MTSGNILASWQEYDITVPRAVPYEGEGWSGYENGNDYTTDLVVHPPPISHWRFEPADIHADSMGNGNILFDSIGTPSSELTHFIEGSGGVKLTSSDRLRINDTDLSANMPFKNGTANQTISICFWYKQVGGGTTVISKTLACRIWPKHPGVEVTTYPSDVGVIEHLTATELDKWYHIGIILSPTTRRIRVFDNTAEAILGTDVIQDPVLQNVSTWAWELYVSSPGTVYLDDIVIFNREISVAEIDAIRSGTYPPT